MSQEARSNSQEKIGNSSGSGRNTKKLFTRIALVSDFDDSLAPDSVSAFLETCEVDPDHFWNKRVQPLVDDGWDPMPAVFHRLIQISHDQDDPEKKITRDRLAEFGRSLELFDGVRDMFDSLGRRAKAIDERIDMRFYIVSCGIGEIIRNSPIAKHFSAIWATELHFNESGEIDFLKRVISHTEKTRYLYQIAMGEDDRSSGMGQAFDLHRSISAEELTVPLSQMIYLGDGLTDVPCFSVINQEKGVALGLFKESTARKWGNNVTVKRGQRVENLASADFSPRSELMKSLNHAVDSIAHQIALRELSIEE